MRTIKVRATLAWGLHNPGEKHEIRVEDSNMTNIIRLTDGYRDPR
jgi:hypothetical protein